MVNNTCFLQVEKFLVGDAVFLRVQPSRAGEHGGGDTCVDVMYDAVERLWRGGAGTQQRREFLEQLLYLGRESGDGGGGLRTPGATKRSGTCLGEGAASCRTCCLAGIIESSNLA